jgi:hypothetical protein
MTRASEDFQQVIASNLVPSISRINNRTIRSDMYKITQAVGQAIYSLSYSLSSPIGLDNIASHIETNLTPKYVAWINKMAVSNPSKYWHMYEPRHIGQSEFRLFEFKINKGRGAADFTANVTFRPSKMRVPLRRLEATPGPTGKVMKQRHVFYNKAYVLEYGLPIKIKPRNGKYLVYAVDEDALIFRSNNPVQLMDTKRRPTYGAMHVANNVYFGSEANGVIDRTVRRYTNRAAKRSEHASTVNLSVTMANNQQAKSIAKAVALSLKGIKI